MGHQRRIPVDGLLLHVTARCNNQMFYFEEPEDYQALLDLMGAMIEAQRIYLYDYSLMSNHSHWLLSQRGDSPVSDVLRWVFGQYARWYNKKHQRKGHFWQGRYRTTVIEQDAHALVCMRYIALNPVRALVVARPGDYPWSGYQHYVGIRRDPLIKDHPVYMAFGRYSKQREERYQDFVESQLGPDRNQRNRRISGAFALGSKYFESQIKGLIPKLPKP